MASVPFRSSTARAEAHGTARSPYPKGVSADAEVVFDLAGFGAEAVVLAALACVSQLLAILGEVVVETFAHDCLALRFRATGYNERERASECPEATRKTNGRPSRECNAKHELDRRLEAAVRIEWPSGAKTRSGTVPNRRVRVQTSCRQSIN
jgi:hypothetical protein